MVFCMIQKLFIENENFLGIHMFFFFLIDLKQFVKSCK